MSWLKKKNIRNRFFIEPDNYIEFVDMEHQSDDNAIIIKIENLDPTSRKDVKKGWKILLGWLKNIKESGEHD